MFLLSERRLRFSKGVSKDLTQTHSAAPDIPYQPRTVKAVIGNVPFIHRAGCCCWGSEAYLERVITCFVLSTPSWERNTVISPTFSPSGNHHLISGPLALIKHLPVETVTGQKYLETQYQLPRFLFSFTWEQSYSECTGREYVGKDWKKKLGCLV